MIRGIKFNMPNQYNSFLKNIFKEIGVEKYSWEIIEEETYLNNNKELGKEGNRLFSEGIVTGGAFKEKINLSSYYVMFLNAQAYLDNNKHNRITCYEDFLKSECQIAILIADGIFVEIYLKDNKILENIKLNAQESNFAKVEYITDENDKREGFSAI